MFCYYKIYKVFRYIVVNILWMGCLVVIVIYVFLKWYCKFVMYFLIIIVVFLILWLFYVVVFFFFVLGINISFLMISLCSVFVRILFFVNLVFYIIFYCRFCRCLVRLVFIIRKNRVVGFIGLFLILRLLVF